MRHLTAVEAYRDFQAVTLCQELLTVFQLYVEIVDPDDGRHSYFLNLNHVLIALGFLFSLCLLELVLAIVHELANRRSSAGRNLDKVKILLNCDIECIFRRDDTKLFAVFADEPYLFIADFFVNLIGRSADNRTPPKSLQLSLP